MLRLILTTLPRGVLPARLDGSAGETRSFDSRSAYRRYSRNCGAKGHQADSGVSRVRPIGDFGDKRPVFQQMIERACGSEHAFDAIAVHSYSRFFHDTFGRETSPCESWPSTGLSWFRSRSRWVMMMIRYGLEMMEGHRAVRPVSVQGKRKACHQKHEGER